MEILLTSTRNHATVQTCFDSETKTFKTFYSIKDRKSLVEEFTKIDEITATHDFWCKITGIIQQPYSRNEVYLHAKAILKIVNRGGILSA